ncbi:MAG: class I SAM-dependent rRNA methyltransferase, partial [Oscillospiraceae bacterium]
YAWQYRKTVMAEDISCCRVIFGEADFFPGLTVDRFGSILVAQTLSLGMEKLKDIIFPLLVCVLREDGQDITAIYERNDVAIRRLEGLTESKGFYDFGEEIPTCTTTVICENNIEYEVDFENGQKTGFFLDQKYNRALVAKMAKGKRVLDCFTHTGSFALNAAYGGAAHVTAVDVSESAVEMAKKNALRNALDVNMDFIAADVFELLPALEKGSAEKYDFIILDPPAFTKSRKTATNAMRGYKEINYRAMKLLPRGGYLATCSCSHFAEETEFCKMLKSSARDAGVELRQIAVRAAAPDHPVLWNVSETQYLKFYVFQIV